MVLLWAFFVLQGRDFRCFEGYSFYHQWRFRLKSTSLFGRNEAFYASKRSYFTGVKRLPERGRLLLRQGVSGLRATFRACPKHLTGLRKIPFAYTQNRFVCFFITMLDLQSHLKVDDYYVVTVGMLNHRGRNLPVTVGIMGKVVLLVNEEQVKQMVK